MNLNHLILALPILIPMVGGGILLAAPQKDRRIRCFLVEGTVVAVSILTWWLILTKMDTGESFILFKLAGNLRVYFEIDGMGAVFAGLVSFLWPLATLYAFEYMKHDKRENTFFAYYTMTYGVTMGIAFAGNMVTLYMFYELLTLVTFPLVLHTQTKEAIRASRKYLYYSIGGAAFAFVGLVFVLSFGTSTDFVMGGVLKPLAVGDKTNLLLFMYVLAFFGFGVKAAIFPCHGWLPSASVAPTPVTALLHAVAVVKSGAFAILRLTYYSYGTDFLKGTWAQTVVLLVVMTTIIYGSTMAVREVHLKRRLAYSTISNLSYILLGAVMMSPLGLIAALSHMVFHAFMKICSFFCAGAVMHQSGREYVYDIDGMGKRMPVTFTCFTIASLSLVGIPLFSGFISKWNIAAAIFDNGSVLAYCGLGVLLYGAFMTAVYMLTVVIRAFFPAAVQAVSPGKEESNAALKGWRKSHGEMLKNLRDPGWMMLVPLVIFAAVTIGFGLYSGPIVRLFQQIAGGMIG